MRYRFIVILLIFAISSSLDGACTPGQTVIPLPLVTWEKERMERPTSGGTSMPNRVSQRDKERRKAAPRIAISDSHKRCDQQ